MPSVWCSRCDRHHVLPEVCPEVDGGPFAVWCRVSGGVTGTREAWLKSNGTLVLFDTRAEAEAEASRLNKQMNHPHSTADFRYTARQYDGF